jgi:hypothetical protein
MDENNQDKKDNAPNPVFSHEKKSHSFKTRKGGLLDD